jgi:hypothetical protein
MTFFKRIGSALAKIWRGIGAGGDMGNADQSIVGAYTVRDNDREAKRTGARGEL